MKKIVYLWGAGYYADFIYSVIDKENCEIKGLIDSDSSKQGSEWKEGLYIFSPDILFQAEFDFIFISPRSYLGIVQQCIDMGIPEKKIIIYWRDHDALGLFENRADRVIESEKKYAKYRNMLLNAPYEWGLREVPIIKSSTELLKRIITDKCSLCRYGDGEFEIMRYHKRWGFQDVDVRLTQRLREIIVSKHQNIIIALADNFGNLEKYKEEAADDIREYMIQSREDIYKMIDMDGAYYNAYVSRPYIIYNNKRHAENIFKLFKEIWKDRSILLLEGMNGKIGVGNDLFDGATMIRRIECPNKNAWEKYEDILSCVRQNAQQDDLIFISLGPAATVIAYDLAIAGYQALDIGQLDNEYEWYIRNADSRIPIAGKLVSEVNGGCCDDDSMESHIDLTEYRRQIIAEIK